MAALRSWEDVPAACPASSFLRVRLESGTLVIKTPTRKPTLIHRFILSCFLIPWVFNSLDPNHTWPIPTIPLSITFVAAVIWALLPAFFERSVLQIDQLRWFTCQRHTRWLFLWSSWKSGMTNDLLGAKVCISSACACRCSFRTITWNYLLSHKFELTKRGMCVKSRLTSQVSRLEHRCKSTASLCIPLNESEYDFQLFKSTMGSVSACFSWIDVLLSNDS
jgi:hypothetical protein